MPTLAIADADAVPLPTPGQARYARLMAAHDALLDLLLAHPWSVTPDAMHIALDCHCAACESLDSLRQALLAYAQAEPPLPPDRLPTRPPPRALHFFRVQRSGRGAFATNWYEPLCATRARGAQHGTTNKALVTCPKCRAALATGAP